MSRICVCSHKSIPDKCTRMHSTFGPYQHLYHSRKSYQCNTDVAFSADDSQIAVSEDGRLPSEHVMVWYKLKGDDLDEISGLLQIWKLRDHTECMYPLGINMDTPVPPHVIHGITTLVSSFPLY